MLSEPGAMLLVAEVHSCSCGPTSPWRPQARRTHRGRLVSVSQSSYPASGSVLDMQGLALRYRTHWE